MLTIICQMEAESRKLRNGTSADPHDLTVLLIPKTHSEHEAFANRLGGAIFVPHSFAVVLGLLPDLGNQTHHHCPEYKANLIQEANTVGPQVDNSGVMAKLHKGLRLMKHE
eukprot:TRINITY_DN53769_c0_g1_i3.p1 TRINITY_DN53769_c0_g1~~TRINITY_DN53769_c0_g1_i3.p1  ORF type:complete len:111 (-),score=15.80 TRINITY_DN53769_c0_g1_i3:422-754(-)